VAAPAISLEGVSKRFGRVDAVRECTLSVPRGAFVSLLGPSGCGKTTLLRMIGGFEQQDSGTIRVHGEQVDFLPPNKRDVNTVFQGYALFPHKTVFENIAFPLEIARVPKAERRERVREMLSLVRLEAMEDRRASQLSGGQGQRVALARALVGRPAVLLLDEPLAALDLSLRKAMQLELRRIHEELGTTFLYVTHDQTEALTMSDRIVLMDGGEIVQHGPPDDVYDRPQTVFASSFLGEANLLSGQITHTDETKCVVAVGDFTVVAPATPELERGDSAVLCVRPERVTMSPNGSIPLLENRLTGTIKRRIFMGHLVRLLIEVSPGVVLTVERNAADADVDPVGSQVDVAWSKQAVVVLREH
jgi:spermidine/putrescine ABC transporter ATP-binding subunit